MDIDQKTEAPNSVNKILNDLKKSFSLERQRLEYKLKGDRNLFGKGKHGLQFVSTCENQSISHVLIGFKTKEVEFGIL